MSKIARPGPIATARAASGNGRTLLGALLLAGLTFLAYLPALRGSFIWDDDRFLTGSPLIKAADGLRRFWLTGEAPDYWPLASTSLWLEWRIWGMHAAGYHATNLLMHIAEAFLLWTILKRLGIPGAYLAALFFALHPVNAESVAWITQRKNLTAMLFFLLSILCFLKTNPGAPPGANPRPDFGRWYGLSLLAFVLAMLGKGSVAPLPFVFLGIIAWRRRPEPGDWARIAPFFAVAAIFTCVNVWFQSRDYVHFRTAGFVERMLGAATAAWFYAGKAIWPAKLCFVYPPWSIGIGDFRRWMPLVAAAGVTLGLCILGRRGGSPWGRGGLFAWLYFCAMLAPVMGFTDVGFMEFSLVADHYQHLAIIAVTVLAAAGLVSWLTRLPLAARPSGWVLCTILAGLLGLLTLRQSRTYGDPQELYTATLEQNPGSWMAHFNLADVLASIPSRLPEAVAHYEEALRIKPNNPEAHFNLGVALAKIPGRMPEAVEHYEAALRIKPNYAEAQDNLALELAKIPGRMPEAVAHYEAALRIKPDFAEAHYNLAVALATLPGRLPEALAHYEEALRIKSDLAEAHNNLANALATLPGRLPEAMAHYEEALRIKPDSAEAHDNLANALAALPGRQREALAHYDEALRIKPDFAEAHDNLANALAKIPGRMPEAVGHYEAALRLEPNFAEAHENLANALVQIPGRMPEALSHYEAALRIKPNFAEAHYNLAVALVRIPGRLPEAVGHYEEALRIKPNFAAAHYNLGNALAALPGRLPEAVEHYEEALRIDPDNAQAQNNIAVLYARSGRFAEAAAHWALALKLNPALEEARENLNELRARAR